MAHFIFRSISVTLFALITQSAYAIQVKAEDVSNQVITCDQNNPLLKDTKTPACLTVPPGTLAVTATLDTNEDISALNELHVVIQYQGIFYKYGGMTSNNVKKRWMAPPTNKTVDALVEPSFTRAAFDTKGIMRFVYLGDFAAKKGAEIHVGTRAATNEPFSPQNMKHIYTVQ